MERGGLRGDFLFRDLDEYPKASRNDLQLMIGPHA